MLPTIREMILDGKVCQSFDLGLIQEVISPHLVQLVLSVSDAWEERERRLNMYTLIYWLIALALYPQLSQRAVYSKVLSGLRLLLWDSGCTAAARSFWRGNARAMCWVPSKAMYSPSQSSGWLMAVP